MATRRKHDDERPDLRIPLSPVAPVAFEHAEPDPAKRDAAWASFVAFARSPKSELSGTVGTRDDWYDEMLDEPSR